MLFIMRFNHNAPYRKPARPTKNSSEPHFKKFTSLQRSPIAIYCFISALAVSLSPRAAARTAPIARIPQSPAI